MVNGHNEHSEFNFDIKYQVDHFDQEKFGVCLELLQNISLYLAEKDFRTAAKYHLISDKKVSRTAEKYQLISDRKYV